MRVALFGYSIVANFWILLLLSASLGIFTPAMGSLNPKVLLETWDITYLPFGLGATKMARGLGFLVGPLVLNKIMEASGGYGTNSLYVAGGFYGIAAALALACFFKNKIDRSK